MATLDARRNTSIQITAAVDDGLRFLTRRLNLGDNISLCIKIPLWLNAENTLFRVRLLKVT